MLKRLSLNFICIIKNNTVSLHWWSPIDLIVMCNCGLLVGNWNFGCIIQLLFQGNSLAFSLNDILLHAF
jgi:hypothetical protein